MAAATDIDWTDARGPGMSAGSELPVMPATCVVTIWPENCPCVEDTHWSLPGRHRSHGSGQPRKAGGHQFDGRTRDQEPATAASGGDGDG
jgi:hypothetical protein